MILKVPNVSQFGQSDLFGSKYDIPERQFESRRLNSYIAGMLNLASTLRSDWPQIGQI